MSFNVSRFLVRVRQFWTRDRLVPVLGVTALFLFGLTSFQYLSTLLGDRPIVARHFIIHQNTVQPFENNDGERSFWQFDHEDNPGHWHHEHDHTSRRNAWEHARNHKRHTLELYREMKDRHRIEVKNRVLEFDVEQQDSEDDEVIIMQEDGENKFEITINGKKILIQKDKEI